MYEFLRCEQNVILGIVAQDIWEMVLGNDVCLLAFRLESVN